MGYPLETEFPFEAVLFDWAYTLVDLGKEDDTIPFRELLLFLKKKCVFNGDLDEICQDYRKLFYGMIDVSKITHREANFELVLKYLLLKYNINLDGNITVQKLLTFYYRSIYKVRKVYPDVIPILDWLKTKGIRLGIISNTTNPEFMKDWERCYFGLDRYFEFSIYSSGVPYRKPHPSIFELAIHRLKLDPRKVLFVGDDPKADVLGAQGVGMLAVWLNRNGHRSIYSVRPDYEITALSEIIAIRSVLK